MKKLFCVITVFTLTACTPNTINKQKVDNTPKQTVGTTLTANMVKHPAGKYATPAEIAECQKQGGQISKQGLLGYDFCVVEFADKGKVCTDGSDCQAGRCTASVDDYAKENTKATGVCPSNNVPFGCYGTVNKGEFSGVLCVH
ncbi:hypothetical protein LU290_06020 [Moraxella nasibovis]|uniref:hypothetical protein n=1 Tax=Moraxella nasibovis TaxID=2904120 RepID=UPI00241035B5|nr:hypothetical protein [Moraxella nasibovis]WFF37827.1 hypothetical protein LU290_06020 [Moraxella nasibovis]